MKIKRSTIEKWKRIFFIFLITSFIFSLFYIYFRTHLFTIYNYEFSGIEENYQETLRNDFINYEQQKIFLILPGNSIFSYHAGDIKSDIYKTLPNTSSVKISITSLHSLKISVESYKPYLKLGDKKAITKDAIIYTEIHDIDNLPLLSFSSTTVITPEILSKINDISPKISSILFDIKNINVDEYSDIYLNNENNTTSIIFSSESGIKKIWSTLLSAIDTDPLKSRLKNEKDNLKYLDARFGNKIFYKFTNDAHTIIIPSHDTASTTQATSTH